MDNITEKLNFNSIIEYVRENIFGLLLLLVAIFIVYFVDYINHLNTLIFSQQFSIPSFPSSIPTQIMQKSKGKKIKKH